MAVGTEIEESTEVGTLDVIVVGRTHDIATFGDRPRPGLRPALLAMSSRINRERRYQA
jgi:hypothetical protein